MILSSADELIIGFIDVMQSGFINVLMLMGESFTALLPLKQHTFQEFRLAKSKFLLRKQAELALSI